MVEAPEIARELLPIVPLPSAGTARLWWASLDVGAEASRELRALLTDEERQRADAYPHAARGRRFAHGRAVLRLVLGAWLSREPGTLDFASNPDGKPLLVAPLPEGDGGGVAPHFNLSHAHDHLLLAISPAGAVGVDLSAVDQRLPIEKVAPRFFSHAERAALAAAPGEQARRERFARLWVRKEAWLKAVGTGISERMRETDFTPGLDSGVAPGGSAPPIAVDGWEIRDVAGVPPGLVASVATRAGADGGGGVVSG